VEREMPEVPPTKKYVSVRRKVFKRGDRELALRARQMLEQVEHTKHGDKTGT
jgi:hypothetical protein